MTEPRKPTTHHEEMEQQHDPTEARYRTRQEVVFRRTAPPALRRVPEGRGRGPTWAAAHAGILAPRRLRAGQALPRPVLHDTRHEADYGSTLADGVGDCHRLRALGTAGPPPQAAQVS